MEFGWVKLGKISVISPDRTNSTHSIHPPDLVKPTKADRSEIPMLNHGLQLPGLEICSSVMFETIALSDVAELPLLSWPAFKAVLYHVHMLDYFAVWMFNFSCSSTYEFGVNIPLQRARTCV